MALRPSTAPQRVPLPSPPESSLPALADPESDSLRASSPTVTRLLATVVTDPSFESTAASALVAELVDFAAHCRLDYTASLGAESLRLSVLRTSGMTTLRVLLHVAAQRDYELHSLAFSTAFLQGSLHEEIWLRRPPGFTGSFPPGTQWSLRRPVYGLRQAPREWHDTVRTTLSALGFAPSTTDPSLFLRTDTNLPPFYILVYVDDLVFATADTAGLAHILQHFNFTYSSPQATPLSTRHSLSALPSDVSVQPSGPYPELVSCLMYLITCTRPDLAYRLSILARYVAPGRHRPEHMDAAKRVLRYLCSTLGMGLMLGGRARVVLTGHADASWRSTLSSSVFSSSCEAEIYAGAMAAQELRWLTYLLTDLGEAPRSPPVLYRGQLHLAYVATRANTADIFTKALQPCDHQRFCTMLVYVDDLVFATTDTEALTLVKAELQERHTCTYMDPSVLQLPILLAIAHSSVYRPLALSSTFGRVPSWLTTWLLVDIESCESEIYAGAMAAQELRCLTYLLIDLGEWPCSPPVLYQRRQLRLSYVASRANTADVFTKALGSGDHQRFCTTLGLVPTLPHLLVA
ncbi:unnamed protein product [Closterium sp. NIES-53]